MKSLNLWSKKVWNMTAPMSLQRFFEAFCDTGAYPDAYKVGVDNVPLLDPSDPCNKDDLAKLMPVNIHCDGLISSICCPYAIGVRDKSSACDLGNSVPRLAEESDRVFLSLGIHPKSSGCWALESMNSMTNMRTL